jgi:hypothetical protein
MMIEALPVTPPKHGRKRMAAAAFALSATALGVAAFLAAAPAQDMPMSSADPMG